MRASGRSLLAYLAAILILLSLFQTHGSVKAAEVDAKAGGAFDDDLMATDDDYYGYSDDDYYDNEESYQDEGSDMEGHAGPREFAMPPKPKVKPLTLEEAHKRGCAMDPPFLYFTFHSAGKVVKYSRDGCFLDDQVLRGPLLGPGTLEFRQMAVGPHRKRSNALYLAQGHPNNPAIMVFGECASVEEVEEANAQGGRMEEEEVEAGTAPAKKRSLSKHRAKKEAWVQFLDNGPLRVGQREMIDIVTGHRVSKDLRKRFPGKYKYKNQGAKHNFGLAIEFDPYPSDKTQPEAWEGPLYASFQHTDLVQRFSGVDLAPSPLPPALTTGPSRWMPYYPGTFHQFGSVGKHKGGMKTSEEEQGVRGVVVVGTHIWIANENLGGILVIDKASGVVEEFLPVNNPIAMFHYRIVSATQLEQFTSIGGDIMGDNLVYISSKKGGGHPGKVLAVSEDNYQIVREFHSPGMVHPAGLAVFSQVLYVVEQVQGMVHTFSTVTGEYLGPIIKAEDMPYERIEQVALTPC